jgi:hypothetical protein
MSEDVSFRELSVGDAPKIAAAISRLAGIGLTPLFPESEFPEVAREIVEEREGSFIPDPPLPQLWADLALTGSAQLFANAIHYDDHCFDVADEEDYAQIVASIMALAGEDWPGDGVTVAAASVVREGRYGPSHRMEITIDQQGGCAPFDLSAHKDFDWSVVTRLNERLPSEATGRFAAFFDGNATIVYLKPDQIEELGKLFGYDFVSEIEPSPEREPPPSHLETTIQNPLPVGALAGIFLMGVMGAGMLTAMILGGAPYTIPSDNITPISLESAPLAFIFLVMVYTVIAGFGLIAPPYLIVMRWSYLQQARRDSS